jgi:hypothetical protein
MPIHTTLVSSDFEIQPFVNKQHAARSTFGIAVCYKLRTSLAAITALSIPQRFWQQFSDFCSGLCQSVA